MFRVLGCRSGVCGRLRGWGFTGLIGYIGTAEEIGLYSVYRVCRGVLGGLGLIGFKRLIGFIGLA